MSAVSVRGLTVRYGPAGTPPAVDALDLSADAGEVLVVLGPNGAGKTSTIEAIEGYRPYESGEVRVLGLDPRRDHGALTSRIGVMLQRGGVYPMLGPRQVLDLFGSYYPAPVPTDQLLELVGLGAVSRTPWKQLSGGEQQRLSLALALVGRPEVAFLDEPTAGVDPEGRLAVRAVVAELRTTGVCVLLTTHELDEAEKMADRIAIVSSGRVVREGTPRALAEAAGHGQPIVTFGATTGLDLMGMTAALRDAAGGAPVAVTEVTGEPGRYRIEGAGAADPKVTAALATYLAEHGAALRDLTTGRTLEDIYFDAVGGAAIAATPSDVPGSADGPGGSGRRARRRPRTRR
jgi:ABC-2 type transport system ATP-binding protein